MRKTWFAVFGCAFVMMCFTGLAFAAKEPCITCHRDISPGQVADWKSGQHSEEDVTCSVCHGQGHKGADDTHLAQLPDEHLCADCHEEKFDQFAKGKHNFGWTAMNALPVTHVEPDELMEGGRGCGGCHNMGIKSEEQKKEQRDKGYRYQNNSCDECHTRHSFSVKEALDPKACQQCHMGYDHPQWEMWSSMSASSSPWATPLCRRLTDSWQKLLRRLLPFTRTASSRNRKTMPLHIRTSCTSCRPVVLI